MDIKLQPRVARATSDGDLRFCDFNYLRSTISSAIDEAARTSDDATAAKLLLRTAHEAANAGMVSTAAGIYENLILRLGRSAWRKLDTRLRPLLTDAAIALDHLHRLMGHRSRLSARRKVVLLMAWVRSERLWQKAEIDDGFDLSDADAEEMKIFTEVTV